MMKPPYANGPKTVQRHKLALPSLLPTTLFDFPSQQYGDGNQGDQAYIGATPSYVVWNVISRYTQPGDKVADPFCGSGTTLDVARDLGRVGLGFDLNPIRPDIKQADARKLPLPDKSVECLFMDPPYGDHILYSDHPDCIGKISAYDGEFFRSMAIAMDEGCRVLKPGGVFALYVCDFFTPKKGFVPVGPRLFEHLSRKLTPVDIIAVTRHNKDLQKGNYRKAAVEQNFFLRGFNYLFLLRKEGVPARHTPHLARPQPDHRLPSRPPRPFRRQ